MPVSSVGRELPTGSEAVHEWRGDDPSRSERAEQVAVAASLGAEPLVGDEHQEHCLGAVDERDAEQEAREDPRPC